MEWNTVERAIKTETDTRTEQKRVGKLGWFISLTYTTKTPPREGEPARTEIDRMYSLERCTDDA